MQTWSSKHIQESSCNLWAVFHPVGVQLTERLESSRAALLPWTTTREQRGMLYIIDALPGLILPTVLIAREVLKEQGSGTQQVRGVSGMGKASAMGKV